MIPFTNHKLSISLKKGQYVITDPCYVFPDDMWNDLCDKAFCNDDDNGVLDVDGFNIWWGQTKYGDGEYNVRLGGSSQGSFGVDAGLFAIFPIEFINKHGSKHSINSLGVKIEMEGLVQYNDGNMKCRSVSVDTGYSENEDEDDGDE